MGLLSAPVHAATYTVTTTASSGAGSLAQAIASANGNPGTDTIAFNISSGSSVKIIGVPVPLPTITDPVLIDGTTQPGYGAPSPASVPVVALVYSGGGLTFDGLRITAGNSTVRGLFIYNFVTGAGIRLENGGNNVIRHNWIGLDASMTARRNTVGIVLVNSSGNTIGGANVGPPYPFPANVISGNTTFPVAGGGRGIELIDASVNVIQGNLIGTDHSTQLARPNDVGIVVRGNSVDNLIGGGADAVKNWISANAREGLLITGTGARLNRVVGNLIGHWPSGFSPLGNGGHGIMLTLGAEGNVIGGVAGERAANTVWYNGGDGVFIAGANNVVRSNFIAFNAANGVSVSGGPSSVGNSITNNSIYGNTCLPIDLWVGAACTVTTNDPGDTDTGPNNLQNIPVLTSVNPVGGSMSISGTLNSLVGGSYQIDVYRRPPSPGAGVGLFHVGRTVLSPGTTAFSLTIPGNFPNDFFSATATDVTVGVPRDTSEFSAERLPTPPVTLPTLSINNVSQAEGSGGGLRNFAFALSLSAASAQPVTVECSTQDGSAKAFCGDYAGQQNVLVTIPAGSLNTTFTVQVREDTDIETHETFFVNLSNPSGATLGLARGTGTIQNDDGAVPNANYRVVTTTAAAGAGSLASAVALANANSDLDVIAFDIPGAGPYVINQSPALPAIVLPLVIDATTQPGYADRPLVELNGGSTPGMTKYGLHVTASDCVVRGLSVTGWIGLGLSAGVLLDGGANHVLEACFIGLNPAGAAAGNEYGAWLKNSSNNRIGGAQVWRRNVVSANRAAGFLLERSGNNRIQGNIIGLDLAGAARNNGFYGIALDDASRSNVIGMSISNRLSEANVIAFSGAAPGVAVFDTASTGNRISGNAIYKNPLPSPGLGIDLGNNGVTTNDFCDGDTGPNNFQNYPEIAQITGSALGPSTTVSGRLNSAAGRSYVLDFYANSYRNASGFGDGETYLGSMITAPAPASCQASFSATLPVAVAHGQWITATATDNTTGDTSEFSRAVEVGPIIVPGPRGSVCFTTLIGRTYSVRCAPTLGGPWTVVATGIAGTGGVVCQPVASPGAMAFYQVTSP